MNVLEMTDSELYEMGLKELKAQLRTAYTARFLQTLNISITTNLLTYRSNPYPMVMLIVLHKLKIRR